MQFFKFFAIASTAIGLVVAAPTPSVEVEILNSTSTLEGRTHCYDNPEKNPDCRHGCGWYSFSANVDNMPLVAAPPSAPLICEQFGGRLFRFSLGEDCECSIWNVDWCWGNSIASFVGPAESQDVHGYSYRCHRIRGS
ncbi:hypothetical protein K505DRAFT_355832 [Melanomma pulvis-pyrius CBS 109.77]|uniref:Uncharacterized protein n=1 Tax=Melanomma pulvis-pyrius CBS 109.77 TaxID=1314802 RepID=A0A6A6XW70_9PLEO|nr:hypothetical protein K505DRAFT_355832 [Melanomma pulvis-pyrius CBS 109.77]